MINVIQHNDVYEVSFQYDPELVDLVKSIPGRIWVSELKRWTIPVNHLGFLINTFKGTVYEQYVRVYSNEHLNENASIDSTAKIPNIDISNIPFYVKEDATPFQHQLDFMKYALGREKTNPSFIVSDQQGLGKTVETLNLALYKRQKYKFKHCLIICCVNVSKYSWYEDIVSHTRGQEEPYILGTRLKRDKVTKRYDTGSAEKLEDLKSGRMYGKKDGDKLPYFLIVNVEALRMKKGKVWLFADELSKLINSGYINMIAIDEVHKNLSPSSLQGKALTRVKKATASTAQWYPITGTPIVNKPTDAYFPLKLIDAHTFKDYWSWCQQFCIYGGFGGLEIMGYKNIPTLKDMLQANMLRRLKKDVLDLPEKIRYTEYVENTPVQTKLYTEFKEEIKKRKEEILQSMNPLTEILRLRQINGSPELLDPSIVIDSTYISKNAKLARLLELLEDIHERGERVIMYSNWVEPLKTLYRFISKKYKTCCYVGTMSEEDRRKHKETFINDLKYTVMIGTIGALGTTHSFPNVQNAIFFDEPYVAVDKEQAEDRIHGIGRGSKTEPSTYYTIITKGTVDDVVHGILKDKQDTANYIVDGKIDIRNNPELFDKLLAG